MQTLNYGERARFKNGTDKTFIYRGGLKELLLQAFVKGPLCPRSPSLLFELADFSRASSRSHVVPSRKVHSEVSQGVLQAECLQRHIHTADAALSLEQRADARRSCTSP